ncbi:MAG: DUF883 family protein [Panacagrimonas sp.]
MREERAARAEAQDLGAATSAHPQQGMQSEFGNARERFIGDLQTLAGHAQELLQVTGAVSGESVAQAREQLRQSLTTAGDTIKRLQGDAMQRGREMAQRTDSYVHENPWQAIAVGVVAGLALGVVASSMARGSAASSTRH